MNLDFPTELKGDGTGRAQRVSQGDTSMNRTMKTLQRKRRRKGSTPRTTPQDYAFANRDERDLAPSFEAEDQDGELEREQPHSERTEGGSVDHDDVLGQYLKQMGSIPLLKRD